MILVRAIKLERTVENILSFRNKKDRAIHKTEYKKQSIVWLPPAKPLDKSGGMKKKNYSLYRKNKEEIV